MSYKKKDPNQLAKRYTELEAQKTSIMNRCEEYAYWTLPSIFPAASQRKDTEQPQMTNSIGARCVNHVSNKLVMTLFPENQPFMRLVVHSDDLQKISQKAQAGDDAAKKLLAAIDAELVQKEKAAMEALNYNTYRTEATVTAKRLIITGNALLYHPPGGKRVQSYSLRDYCVCRDLSGQMIELITRDTKKIASLSKSIQEALRAADSSKYKKDDCDVVLYTQVKLHEEDGRYHVKQSADSVPLDYEGNRNVAFTLQELPWIPLTWNLLRGEDYGRGLVEDYAGTFSALDVLSQSLLSLIAVAADIKWLVNPQSIVDVQRLNDAESGSYHSGAKDDVTALQLDKSVDIQLIDKAIQRFEQQLGQGFLLNSAVTRDAERVTAEEIRYVAQELETSYGGIYSRFSDEWQLKTALLVLRDIQVKVDDNSKVMPRIITGLDSLSRSGDLDNWRLFAQDLSVLQAVPDEMRQAIDPTRLAQWLGIRRGIEYAGFTKSNLQLQQEQQAQMQQQQQLMAAQAGADAAGQIAQTAAKSSMENGQQ